MPIDDTTAPALGSEALPGNPSVGVLLPNASVPLFKDKDDNVELAVIGENIAGNANDTGDDSEPTAIGENTAENAQDTGDGIDHEPTAIGEATTGNAKEIPAGTAKSRGGPGAEKGSESTLPCGCKKEATNLVVCIDGTGNQFGIKNSNVVELYSLLLKNGKQKTWYNSGIGTFAQPSHRFDYYKQRLLSMLDMAVAWNFERIVCGAYRWLSDNYQPGDRIFIFGFSRGAYQARVISAMIDRVGLLHKGNEMQIPFAYDLYRHGSITQRSTSKSVLGDGTISKPATEGSKPERKTLPDNFKATFCHRDAKVHFVGAWDTVSSIGIARAPELLPGTTEGMRHVCYFRHALAFDERRVKFLPEYTSGGVSHDAKANMKKKYNDPVKEVWFAGTHSDIGGGNVENADMIRNGPPLRWMASEAKEAGLLIQNFKTEFLSIEKIDVVESLTWPWWILEWLPLKRLTYDKKDSTTQMPHKGHGRQVRKGQKIHLTIIQTNKDYSPKATMSDLKLKMGTKSLRENIYACLMTSDDHPFRQHLEINEYERARILISQAVFAQQKQEQEEKSLESESGVAATAVVGPMMDTGMAELSWVNVKSTLIGALIDMFKATTSKSLKLDSRFLRTVIRYVSDDEAQGLRVQWRRYADSEFISDMLGSGPNHLDEQQLANDFLRKFTVPVITTSDALYCVSFSGDGKRLFSCGQGGTVGIWDAETGEAQGHIETGMQWILSLAATPGNSEFCVVGGQHPDASNSLQVREAKEHGELKVTFDDNDGDILSVGVHDESIVSASDDGSICIWKRADGTIVKKFEAYSQSVAFSFDGSKVVLASSQGISIGEVNTQETDLITLQGPDIDEHVFCVAADDKHIVGSSNPNIRVWDADSKEPKQLTVLEGHTDIVWSVCFATNSKNTARFIVSGSDDGLVKVWDAKTYRWRKNLEGHLAGVTSVAFSPGTFRVASADRDGTIMVWECDSF